MILYETTDSFYEDTNGKKEVWNSSLEVWGVPMHATMWFSSDLIVSYLPTSIIDYKTWT